MVFGHLVTGDVGQPDLRFEVAEGSSHQGIGVLAAHWHALLYTLTGEATGCLGPALVDVKWV